MMLPTTAFLVGQRIYLRAVNEDDAKGPYLGWFNDELVCQGNNHHIFPFTKHDALMYIQNVGNAGKELILAIVFYEADQHIGNIALQRIHPIYRSAEFSIIIGDSNFWGMKLGLEAGKLVCDHGFFTLNLNRISCGTFETNLAMQRLAHSLGMKEEGRRRKAAFKNGRSIDIIEYGVLRDEYEKHWEQHGNIR